MSGFGGDLWKRRIRTFYNVLDFDHDNKFTEADMDAIADRYIKLGKLDEVTGKQVRRKLIGIYREYLGHLGNNPTSQAEFVDAMYAKGPIRVGQSGVFFHGLFFDVIDINGDGVVSKDEYHLYAQIILLSPEAEAKSFDAIDTDHDGKISYDEFVAVNMEFFAGTEGGDINLVWGPLAD